jgi:hypothetical protein
MFLLVYFNSFKKVQTLENQKGLKSSSEKNVTNQINLIFAR